MTHSNTQSSPQKIKKNLIHTDTDTDRTHDNYSLITHVCLTGTAFIQFTQKNNASNLKPKNLFYFIYYQGVDLEFEWES